MSPRFVAPPGFDHRYWLDRWDAMQEYYWPHRAERFDLLARLVAATQGRPCRLLDLGCGTGSLTAALLAALPKAQVIGLDLDDALLLLAKRQLEPFGDRAQLVRRNLRDPDLFDGIGGPIDAAVSTGALHWLSPEELGGLYGRVLGALRPGGLFANADHVGCASDSLQKAWTDRAEERRRAEHPGVTQCWGPFWSEFGAAMGQGMNPYDDRETTFGPWEGVEEGLPLSWHFDRLREVGFAVVDCFWRCDGDAIYGAVK